MNEKLNLQNKTKEELVQIAEAVKVLADKQKFNKIKYVFPDKGNLNRHQYTHALKFMAKGKDHRFRVYMGGNRSGKSFTMGVELAYHITGEYPSWWDGKVMKKPKSVWIVAESVALFKSSLQKLLFGEAGEDIGTGLLPLAEKNNQIGLVSWSALPGLAGTIGAAICRHKKGHMVHVEIKTNEMNREQFQAANVDIIAFDEEPKADIYNECIMRLMGTGNKEPGIGMLAFTPLKGLSDVVLRFLPNGQIPEAGSSIETPERYVCRVEWENVPHLSEAEKKTMLEEVPENERDARAKGIPQLGSGKVFTTEEDFFLVKPFEIPDYWPKCVGLDYGWTATAAIWLAQDPKTKIYYLYAEYKRGHIIDEIHIEAIKAFGLDIPIIDDPHCGMRDDGKTKRDFFRGRGLTISSGLSGNAGFDLIRGSLETGKFKVFNTNQEWIKEYRIFRYDTKDPNKIALKQNDHLLDATKYCFTRFDWYARADKDFLESRNPENIVTRIRDDSTGY